MAELGCVAKARTMSIRIVRAIFIFTCPVTISLYLLLWDHDFGISPPLPKSVKLNLQKDNDKAQKFGLFWNCFCE